jgi:hypothetical protein
MLTPEEKKEMLEDGLSAARRDDFRVGRRLHNKITFDEYLRFLNDMQSCFKSTHPRNTITITKLNKL